jgi:peptide/nickel transport system substrate-binding protein
VRRSWFANPFFRKGVELAIDKQGIEKNILHGFGKVDGTTQLDGGDSGQDNSNSLSFNYAEAIESLSRAKFHLDKETQTLFDFENRQVEFQLVCEKESTLNLRICGELRRNLKRIGIQVHITPTPQKKIEETVHRNFDWESLLLTEPKIKTLYDLLPRWHSRGGEHWFYPQQEFPLTEWERELDEVLEEMAFSSAPNYSNAQQIWNRVLTDSAPVITTITPLSLRLYRLEIKDVLAKLPLDL